ncbi:MAG: hypothetical protein WDO16_25240 [Bacteroidota bacterium]
MKGERREIAWLCVVIVMGTIYTFFSAGMVNGHYLIQLYPFYRPAYPGHYHFQRDQTFFSRPGPFGTPAQYGELDGIFPRR